MTQASGKGERQWRPVDPMRHHRERDETTGDIQTAHFQKYKQGTLHMVKSLKLQDLSPLSTETMDKIFKRLK